MPLSFCPRHGVHDCTYILNYRYRECQLDNTQVESKLFVTSFRFAFRFDQAKEITGGIGKDQLFVQRRSLLQFMFSTGAGNRRSVHRIREKSILEADYP